MVLLWVDAGPLVPRLRSELAALLTSLTDGDWAQPTSCPGWSVHDIAAHLLGVELGNVSVPGTWSGPPPAGNSPPRRRPSPPRARHGPQWTVRSSATPGTRALPR